jgi:hypothetical protein
MGNPPNRHRGPRSRKRKVLSNLVGFSLGISGLSAPDCLRRDSNGDRYHFVFGLLRAQSFSP